MSIQDELKYRKYCISFSTGCNLESKISDDCRKCRDENPECFRLCYVNTERLISYHSQYMDKFDPPKRIVLSKLCRQMIRNKKNKDEIICILKSAAANQGKFGSKAKQAAEDTYYYVSKEVEFKEGIVT